MVRISGKVKKIDFWSKTDANMAIFLSKCLLHWLLVELSLIRAFLISTSVLFLYFILRRHDTFKNCQVQKPELFQNDNLCIKLQRGLRIWKLKMSKPRGVSDPPDHNFQSAAAGYCTFSLPKNLETSIQFVEPFASISASALLTEDVSHSGWIRKEGFGIKNWKNRFMVLHHGCVYYFKGTDSGSPKGKFALNGRRCERAPERENVDRFPYVFKVVPNQETQRTYYFSSPSKAEMEGWIDKINGDIKLHCTSPSELYDYAAPGEICAPKCPTIPKEKPAVPSRAQCCNANLSEVKHPFLTESRTCSLPLPHRFPKSVQSKVTPESDSEDSDDDLIPAEQVIYLDVLPDVEESCDKSRKVPALKNKPGVKLDQEERTEDFEYLPTGCFQPDLSKDQAKVLLKLGRTLGGYIVHASETSDTKLALSVWICDGVKRYLIFKRNGLFSLYPSTTDEQFPDLHHLIEFYYHHPLPKSTVLLTAPFSL